MADKNLNGEGLNEVWLRTAQLVKKYTGAVDLSKGDLQAQVSTASTVAYEAKALVSEKADSIYYDEDNNKLQLKSGDTVLSETTITGGGGGGGGIPLAQPTSVSLTNADEAVTIKWTDPVDVTLDGATLAKWAGTLVVRKAGSAPTSKTDGVVVVDSKTRDAYKTTGFKDTGLTNDTEYFYGIFPYTTGNMYTYDYTDSITPVAIYPSAATGVTAEAGNAQVKVTFTKPSDASYARIVYKKGSAPSSPTDGTSTNNVTSPFTITGLTNDSLYYAKVFTYNAKGRYTASSAVSFTPKALTIVTWADGSLEDIAKMLEAHYAGTIDVADYWAVGDTKTISLSAMAATGVGESHRATDYEVVIIGINHDDLKTPINGKTKAAVTLQLKNCLTSGQYTYMTDEYNASGTAKELGYMNSSNTNSGGWEGCARRTWCNNIFKNALPSALSNIVKTVLKKNYKVYNSTTITTTDDDVFLLSETEIFGTNTYSAGSTEGTQYDYFKTTSNRCKDPKWNSSSASGRWWERSPHSSNSTAFCYVNASGMANDNNAGYTCGLAPAFCL